jgi:RimJ/RimL family protein N-acetyltransferase
VTDRQALRLTPLTRSERQQIRAWPPYPPIYQTLDYALRRGGWLDTLAYQRRSVVLGAHLRGELVGFSLLVPKAERVAEFFVALRGDLIGQGLGTTVCVETLGLGFRRNAFRKIFLVVRENHAIGIRLYTKIGFRRVGRAVERTNHFPTRFYVMDMTKRRFQSIHGAGVAAGQQALGRSRGIIAQAGSPTGAADCC